MARIVEQAILQYSKHECLRLEKMYAESSQAIRRLDDLKNADNAHEAYGATHDYFRTGLLIQLRAARERAFGDGRRREVIKYLTDHKINPGASVLVLDGKPPEMIDLMADALGVSVDRWTGIRTLGDYLNAVLDDCGYRGDTAKLRVVVESEATTADGNILGRAIHSRFMII